MNPKELIIDRNNLFVGFVIVLAVSVGLVAVAVSEVETSSQSNSYDTWAQVNESDGQNISAGIATGEGMAFGELFEGTNVTKSLNLNSEDLALIESSSEGNISEGLIYDEKVLFQNQTSIPYKYRGREPGYYEGEIVLDIKTADNYWGEKWLDLRYRLPF